MTPFNLQFWGSLYEPTNAILETVALNWVDLLKLVSLILGIPLFFGMLIKHYYPEISNFIFLFSSGSISIRSILSSFLISD